jgi:two-component system, OmpR family, phosphate regulon sensor histidine kinase PhoR
LGIITLQFFWLRDTYQHYKHQFINDASNALNYVSASVLYEAANLQAVDSPYKALMGDLKNGRFTPGQIVEIDEKDLNKIFNDSLKSGERNLRLLTIKEDNQPGIDINVYKQKVAVELSRRGIRSAFELAILDSNRKVIAYSDDNKYFYRSDLKTAVVSILTKNTIEYIQIAFPGSIAFIFKRLAWQIALSCILIVACLVLFPYLVLLFLRQKKIYELRAGFMENMAHELKTPISSMSIAMELLSAKNSTEKTAYFNIISNELKRLNVLVESILKISSFENNEIKLFPVEIHISDWIDEIHKSFIPILDTKDAAIEIENNSGEQSIIADRTHLTNVFNNLIDNAIKYNTKPGCLIKILLRDEQNFIRFEIQDNGNGIPEQYLDMIFQKFFRVPSGNIHNTKGYGLGLSYVKSIIRLHGGDISVTSKKDIGSTFSFKIPKSL